MLNLTQFFKSKTIWATAATFIFNGLQATHPIVSTGTANEINMFLMGLIAAARTANTQNK